MLNRRPKEYWVEWREKNRQKFNDYNRKYRAKNREKVLAIQRKSYQKHRNERLEWSRNKRNEVLNFYSGGNPRCNCCGENTIQFLSIDHIEGGGTKHREELNKTGVSFYIWLIKNGFPEGYQILCHNCNLAKGFYGACPHDE